MSSGGFPVTRRILAIAIALSLGAIVVFLAGGAWLKRPFGPDDDIEAILAGFDVLRGAESPAETWDAARWEEIGRLVDRLESAWQRVQRRIQFSVQIDDLLLFSEELQRLKAAVETRSRPLAWQSVRLLQAVWRRM